MSLAGLVLAGACSTFVWWASTFQCVSNEIWRCVQVSAWLALVQPLIACPILAFLAPIVLPVPVLALLCCLYPTFIGNLPDLRGSTLVPQLDDSSPTAARRKRQ